MEVGIAEDRSSFETVEFLTSCYEREETRVSKLNCILRLVNRSLRVSSTTST